MKLKRWLAVGILFAASRTVSAQEVTPVADVFGGFSLYRTDQVDVPRLFIVPRTLKGWASSVTFNASRWFGATADFSGHYGGELGSPESAHNYLFGPTFFHRTSKVSGFAHSLLGMSRVARGFTGSLGNTTESRVGFAAALGGGLDWHIAGPWSIRLAQADYVLTRFTDTITESRDNFRFGTGVVIRFGSK